MAKGPLVTDAVEALIAAVYQKHPKWKASEVRNEVDYRLHKDNPKLPPGWPSLSTVQKVLAKIRKKNELPPAPQAKPWSTATLGDYPIPPEALPRVLELWRFRLDRGEKLSIREAKWAARLSAVKPPEYKIMYEGQECSLEGVHWLHLLADWYSHSEIIYEILDRPFDADVLDRLLMGLPTKIAFECDIKRDEAGNITKVSWALRTIWEDKEGG